MRGRDLLRIGDSSKGSLVKGCILANWFEKVPNFGDMITPFLIRTLTGRRPINLLHVHRGLNPLKQNFRRRETYWSLRQRLGLTNYPEYVLAGSILGWRAWKPDVQVIWGAGFMDPDARLRNRPRRLICVRGEKSYDALPREWRSEVQALGDPGVLVGDLTPDKPAPIEGRIGVVAHYTHKEEPLIERLRTKRDVVVVDIQQDVEDFIRELAACSVVVSSAMHGIIAADGLGLPNRWIRFSDDKLPSGGKFKFQDYFSVAGGEQREPDLVKDYDDVLAASHRSIARDVGRMKEDLLATSPLGKEAV